MKTQSRKSVLFAALFVVSMASFSCNRGVGCPSNFSMGEVVTKVVQKVAQTDIVQTLLK
jgi:excinuclease UvrABC helicase subunit UvrB